MSIARTLLMTCLLPGSVLALSAQGVGSVSVEARPGAYAGRAPAHLHFLAHIELEGARVFNYRWVRSDGALGPERVVRIQNPNQRMITVEDSWQLGAPGQRMEVWEKIQVNCGRQHLTSGPAVVPVTCH